MSPSRYSTPQRPSVVARTAEPLTGKQVGVFLLCLVLLVLAAIGGWRFYRVSLEIGNLKNPDFRIRQHAAEELGKFKSSHGVDPLIAALNDADSDVQASAANALGEIGDQRALQPLLAALRTSKDISTAQDAVAGALSKMGPSAVDPLLADLNYPDPGFKACAAQALGHLKDPRSFQPLLAAMRNAREDEGRVSYAAAEALGNLGPSALEPLMADLKDKHLDGAAGRGLVQLGAPAVDPLIAALQDPSPAFRGFVVGLLGEIKDPRAVDPLVAMLKDNTPPSKKSVEQDANGPHFPQTTDPDSIRESSAKGLGEIKDPRADGPLTSALKDSDARVRQAAANSLSEIGDPSAVNVLLTALREHNADAIAGASRFFVRRGEPGSEDALIEALDKAGDTPMARDFLNSGNQRLRDAATAWAEKNGYQVTTMYEPSAEKRAGSDWGSKR